MPIVIVFTLPSLLDDFGVHAGAELKNKPAAAVRAHADKEGQREAAQQKPEAVVVPFVPLIRP